MQTKTSHTGEANVVVTLFPSGVAHYLIGGLLMGAGVALIFVFTGAVSGISTVFTSTWSYLSKWPFFHQPRFVGTRAWRLVLVVGLILGGLLWWIFLGPAGGAQTDVYWWQFLFGGFLIGFGARLSNGCTAGHGICGLASLQLPSLLAVLTFMATAMVAANVVLALGGH